MHSKWTVEVGGGQEVWLVQEGVLGGGWGGGGTKLGWWRLFGGVCVAGRGYVNVVGILSCCVLFYFSR
jgi:hypothetical protein